VRTNPAKTCADASFGQDLIGAAEPQSPLRMPRTVAPLLRLPVLGLDPAHLRHHPATRLLDGETDERACRDRSAWGGFGIERDPHGQ